MKIPSEEQWLRVEEIVAELQDLNAEDVGSKMKILRESGEPASVLSLVGRWLSLPVEAPPLDIGSVVAGSYTLREQIGEGGMGSVWRATHGMIRNHVALKMIHPGLLTPDFRERFQSEMEVLGILIHPGIVRILHAGIFSHPGQREIPYYVMELVEGVTLDQWASAHREDRAALFEIILKICAAVRHAHDRKVIHRDLKPSNILVRNDGQPVVLDFGIARLASRDADSSDGFSGTPQYAAPEQHLGTDRDFRSGESVDVYAIGAILFEIFAGRRLFEFPKGTTVSEMRRAIVEGQSPHLAEHLAECPPLLDEVVARAVRRDPADRYYSMGEFTRALNRTAATIIRPAAPEQPTWKQEAGALVPGTHWRLVRKLGEGSSGEVWLGVHEQLGDPRVFKFCDSLEKVRTLKRELTIFRLLKEKVGRNRHFIPLHEVSLEDEPPWYLMMDYVEAKDLEAWCASQTGGLADMDPVVHVEIVAQVAEALQAAHESGILHRDIKPANILVSDLDKSAIHNGEPPLLVRIADFGIGQIVTDELQRATRRGFTHTISDLNRFAGTLLYIAPEVQEGGDANARSDVYSLGVIFWQLLTGNLHRAVDPDGWSQGISDPLLQEDLRRCLTRRPEKRWSSAGEFAASLRALPKRRAAEAQQQAMLASRERAAYRRGVLRTTLAAAIILACVGALAALAWSQRQEARKARAQGAIEQAANLFSLGKEAGRSRKGLSLLAEAGAFPVQGTTFRSLAAGFSALYELEEIPFEESKTQTAVPAGPGETVRVASPDGTYLATGHGTNGLDGSVRFLNPKDGQVRANFERKDFPLVPIPEPGFLQFSPDEKLLAVAGPGTSLHILLCRSETADLQSYIFVKGGLQCFDWHPQSRIVATGCADRVVRLWDIESACVLSNVIKPGDFRLPPRMDVPAIDNPLATLDGWRGSLCSVIFDPKGYWLAGLDDAGWLRIWSGFTPAGLPGLPAPAEASMPVTFHSIVRPNLILEIHLNRSGNDGRLTFDRDRLVVAYTNASPLSFKIKPGEMFRETWIAPGLQDLAWSTEPEAPGLCAITSTDVYWIARDTLQSRHLEGKNPAALAYDLATHHWVLPNNKQFCLRWPTTNDFGSTPSNERWELESSKKKQDSRIGAASTLDGRVAIFSANCLQFARGGILEPSSSVPVTGVDGGVYRDLLWDLGGKTITVVYAIPTGLRAESFATGNGTPQRLGAISVPAQRLVAAENGTQLIARSVSAGLFYVDTRSGKTNSIDPGRESKQDAPLAVSADGKWIAAVANSNLIRLIDTESGAYYADFTCPRATTITLLTWHPSGNWLAALTEDGFVQVYSLTPWRDWLRQHPITQ